MAKSEIEKLLSEGQGEAIPESSMRRLGSTAMAFWRTARLAKKAQRQARKGQEGGLDGAQIAKIVTSIGRLKGIAMKMGQIMSYIDMNLPDELREALSVLQSQAQPMNYEQVCAIINEDLAEPEAATLIARLEPQPIAAASIGQVHIATLADNRKIAVKVQYPEIAGAIESDFGPAAIGTKMASLLYPHAHFEDFVQEARTRFLEECDYLHEAQSQERFGEIYQGHPTILVPKVHRAFCGARVLATEFIESIDFDTFLAQDPDQETRNRIGLALFDFYLGTLFRHGIYNCDPHPGNLRLCPDGRLALLDHGCTRSFERSFLAKLVQLTQAIHSDSPVAIEAALMELSIIKAGRTFDYDYIRRMMRGFFGPMLVDEERSIVFDKPMSFGEVAKNKRKLARFSLPGEFLFLFRIRFGLMSVLSRLGAKANWYRLEAQLIEDFLSSE